MMLVVYGCILAVSWFGARFIVIGTMSSGELTSLFSYIMSIMMSLMMLSMICHDYHERCQRKEN